MRLLWLWQYGELLWGGALVVSCLLFVFALTALPRILVSRSARRHRNRNPEGAPLEDGKEVTLEGVLIAQESPEEIAISSLAEYSWSLAHKPRSATRQPTKLSLSVSGIAEPILLRDALVAAGSREQIFDRRLAALPKQARQIMEGANIALKDFSYTLAIRSLQPGDKIQAKGKVRKIASEAQEGYRDSSNIYALEAFGEKHLSLVFLGSPKISRRWLSTIVSGVLVGGLLFIGASSAFGYYVLGQVEQPANLTDSPCLKSSPTDALAYAAVVPFTHDEALARYIYLTSQQCQESAEDVEDILTALELLGACEERAALLREKRLYKEALQATEQCNKPEAPREAALSYFAMGELEAASKAIVKYHPKEPKAERATEAVLLHLVANNLPAAIQAAHEAAELLDREALRVGPGDKPNIKTYYPSSRSVSDFPEEELTPAQSEAKKDPVMERRASMMQCLASYLEAKQGSTTAKAKLELLSDTRAREECILLLVELSTDTGRRNQLLFSLEEEANPREEYPGGLGIIYLPRGYGLPDIERLMLLLLQERVEKFPAKATESLDTTNNEDKTPQPLSAIENARLGKTHQPFPAIEGPLLNKMLAVQDLAPLDLSIRSSLLLSRASFYSKLYNWEGTLRWAKRAQEEATPEAKEGAPTQRQQQLDELIALSALYQNDTETLKELWEQKRIEGTETAALLHYLVSGLLQGNPPLPNALWALLDKPDLLAQELWRSTPSDVETLLWAAAKEEKSKEIASWLQLGLPAMKQFGLMQQLSDNARLGWLLSLYGEEEKARVYQNATTQLKSLYLRRELAIPLYILDNLVTF